MIQPGPFMSVFVGDFMSFQDDINKFSETTKEGLREALKRTVFRAKRIFEENSPVDTGLFRSSWRLGIDKVNEGDSDEPLEAINPDSTCHISNALPYAMRLEDGWSKQAPLGIVKRNESRIQKIYENEIKRAIK